MKNWYIVQSHSSFENKVAQEIKEEAEKANLSDKIEEIIDARTSDAIALALRFEAPIYAYDSILKKAGFTTAISENSKKLSEDKWIQNFVTEQTGKNEDIGDLKKLSVSKLKSLLTKLVSHENYEKAAKVRDELSKRKN